MPHRYTTEQKEFIAANVKGRSAAELTELFNERFGINISKSAMRAYKTNHKLKSGFPPGKHEPSKELVEWRAFVAEHIKGKTTEEITELFNQHFGLNWTVEKMKGFKSRNHFDSGLTGQFEKGHVPFNKGMKGLCMGGKETQFKKGHRPKNYRPVGSERINVDGYIEIKIADPDKWKHKHVWIWEQANGPVPESHAVLFGDGDKMNVELNNLILVSRKQLAILNHMHLIKSDVELTKTAILIADLKNQTNKRKKEMRGKLG